MGLRKCRKNPRTERVGEQITSTHTMIAFAYYGAKNGLLSELLPLLPAADHYCEPFSGSATVLLNRAPSPIETMNDLNGDLVNFFRILRDNSDELVRRLELTPYAYEEYVQAWDETTDDIERARRFYIRTQMDLAKAGHRKDRSWSCNVTYTSGQHSYAVKNFHTKVPGLIEVAQRLKMVQIDNRPALDHIRKFDGPGTLFYCDPPYLPATRKSANDYKYEMGEQAHIELAQVLNACEGRVALSGYDAPIMDELYSAGTWQKIRFKSRKVPMSRGAGLIRQECLWVNYNPYPTGSEIQTTIFHDESFTK